MLLATLSACTLGNAENYKNMLLPIERSTVKVCDHKVQVEGCGFIQILPPRCWDSGWVSPELSHKASITCLRKYCLMELLGQAALGLFVGFFFSPHPSLKLCDCSVKGVLECFLNEDTLFTFISQCSLLSEFLCSCNSRTSLGGLGEHMLSIYKPAPAIHQLCSQRAW